MSSQERTTPIVDAKTKAYQDELIRRYRNNEPLTKSDTADAKKLLRHRRIERSLDGV